MRLIGILKGEKEAFQFYSFLQKEEIACSYESDPREQNIFRFWVTHEDDIEKSLHWFEEFKKCPEDPRFIIKQHPIDTQNVEVKRDSNNNTPPLSLKAMHFRNRIRSNIPITRFIIFICVLLYIWNGYQIANNIAKKDSDSPQYIVTPLMTALLYDVPLVDNQEDPGKAIVQKNTNGNRTRWDGFYNIALEWPKSKNKLQSPMFVKIRQGEVWRLFTPVLLHGGLLHILFNMLWLWMLGRQIEERIKKWQYLAVTLIIGMISNTLQYLMSGSFFLGYSGIVCGLAGFIWMRQRRAPWEGYPLQKGTIAFVAIFIIGAMVLQMISFFLTYFEIATFSNVLPVMNLANTAHVSGAIIGIVLGNIPFFYKGDK